MALPSRSLTRDARLETRAKTMNFKLPHDVVSACAKRDEPPSRRRLIRASLADGLLLMAKGLTKKSISYWPLAISAAFGSYRPTSARHSFLPCIQWFNIAFSFQLLAFSF